VAALAAMGDQPHGGATAGVVSAGADALVVVWDLASRTKKHVLRGHTDRCGQQQQTNMNFFGRPKHRSVFFVCVAALLLRGLR
jgi:WD40 repeat protein